MKEVIYISIKNSWVYTQTLFNADEFLTATRNEYQFVDQKPYQSKKNQEDKGVTVTLLIIHDDKDYGIDKNGHKRENNVLNTFDVTILNGQSELPFNKGDKVSLIKYLPDKSYVINFDVLLRFSGIKKVGSVNEKN